MAVQSAEGYYLYKFHPLRDRKSPGPGNLVRQAGCAYALGLAADRAEDEESRATLASSASRALDVLLRRAVVEDGTLFIAEPPQAGVPNRGKLGTLALSLAALQSTSLPNRYRAERQRLIRAVLDSQRPDGSFRCRTDSTSAADDATSQDFYPGEALIALVREVQAGSGEAQRAMAAALPWYRARFRAQPTTAFVPWQVQAWTLYAEWSRRAEGPMTPANRSCSEFVFEMTDWLLQHQIGAQASNPDLIGGFSQQDRRPTCSTATYTEATIRAFSTAQQLGYRDRADRYREASLLGLDFVRRLQIMPDTAIPIRDSARTIGATTASLSNMTIRCDYDQHTLTAYLTALDARGLLKA